MWATNTNTHGDWGWSREAPHKTVPSRVGCWHNWIGCVYNPNINGLVTRCSSQKRNRKPIGERASSKLGCPVCAGSHAATKPKARSPMGFLLCGPTLSQGLSGFGSAWGKRWKPKGVDRSPLTLQRSYLADVAQRSCRRKQGSSRPVREAICGWQGWIRGCADGAMGRKVLKVGHHAVSRLPYGTLNGSTHWYGNVPDAASVAEGSSLPSRA